MPLDPYFPVSSRLALGLIISSLIGLVAYRRGSLSRSGIFGAIIIGTLVFGFGGWAAGLTLIGFFVSSSLLSHFKESSAQKQKAAEQFDKGGQRDIGQALANGGAAAIFAVICAITGPPAPNMVNLPANLAYASMIGALATANADTWATELGVLSKSPPRLITTLQPVAPGTSGGVSVAGILAALAGATFIAVAFYVLYGMQTALEPPTIRLYVSSSAAQTEIRAFAVVMGGLGGSLFDSFLGATVQAMYYSDKRHKETEKAFERDGTPNRPTRGWRWLNNDWVNFISSLVGAAVAALITIILI